MTIVQTDCEMCGDLFHVSTEKYAVTKALDGELKCEVCQ